ncbi:hypothetical protein AM499_00540 [Bacillus sp. FJAT-22090]|uniref:hypothetical protein n=1 Tax=Bacillus sp. FJAT-22090 TaxID=1581038 RepID=UPI0006B02097|nr:hypothetical protein [Bacillus sp. FJAT-22090]ALC84473.1 hypothetical protein AM499_00540 [Bacillus sp. FJAT-22090]
MKKICILLICSLIMVSCNSISQPFSHTIIDWVDFVKINGKEYEALYSVIIADPKNIGEKIGEVKFKVSDNVSNPSYRTKDGDAAFWNKGTEIFSVIDREDLIAIQDKNSINGYRIYYSRSEDSNFNYHYKDINLETINKIELYDGNTILINTLKNETEINDLLSILNEGTVSASFSPNTTHGDPATYHIVLYGEEEIGYYYSLFFDGNVWFWHPWDTSIVSNEIELYFK